MTPDDTVDLLAYIAAFDQRTVGDADVEAWLEIAEDAGWTYPHAKRAVREYHRAEASKPRITPAAITDTLAAKRAEIRKRLFRTDLTPPRELAGDVTAEIAWRRGYTAAALNAAMDDWARDGRLPDPVDAAPALLASEVPPAISAFAERHALRAPRVVEPADPNQRRAAIEAARAELDQIRSRVVEPS